MTAEVSALRRLAGYACPDGRKCANGEQAGSCWWECGEYAYIPLSSPAAGGRPTGHAFTTQARR